MTLYTNGYFNQKQLHVCHSKKMWLLFQSLVWYIHILEVVKTTRAPFLKFFWGELFVFFSEEVLWQNDDLVFMHGLLP